MLGDNTGVEIGQIAFIGEWIRSPGRPNPMRTVKTQVRFKPVDHRDRATFAHEDGWMMKRGLVGRRPHAWAAYRARLGRLLILRRHGYRFFTLGASRSGRTVEKAQ